MAKKFSNKSLKKLVSVILTSTLTFQMFTGVVYAQDNENATGVKVRITVNGQSKYCNSEAETVAQLLNENSIDAEDYKIDKDLVDTVTAGMQIKLEALPVVHITVDDNEEFNFKAKSETIGQLMLELKELNSTSYKVADGHSSSERLSDGMKVALKSVKEEIYVEKTEIPFKTVKKNSAELYEGETKLSQTGIVGIKEETMKNVYVGDELVDNFCIERKITTEPVDEIILVGTKKKQVVSVGGNIGELEYSKVVTMNATAYCPCASCNGKWAGRPSALGLKVEKGVVAVDPSFIPLGTKLYVEGYGYCIAGDTGGAIKGNRIDLCYDSHSQALSSGWGHTNVKVYVLK